LFFAVAAASAQPTLRQDILREALRREPPSSQRTAEEGERPPGLLLYGDLSPRLDPAAVLTTARNVFTARNWEITAETADHFDAQYRSRDVEAKVQVFFVGGELRYSDDSTIRDGAQRAVAPAQWINKVRVDLRSAFAGMNARAERQAGVSNAQETLLVRAPAVLAADAPIAQAVLAECQVEDTVASNAYSGIRRAYRGRSQITRGAGKELELRLTMLDVTGVGPGPWTRKAITLRADLMEGNRVIASAVFERESGRGGPALRSACTTLGVISVQLGKQIGQWANHAMAGLAADRSVSSIKDDLERDDPPRTVAAPAADLRAVERLEELHKLRDEGLITGKEYEQKRAEILKDL